MIDHNRLSGLAAPYRRANRAFRELVLHALGVPTKSDFWEFYVAYDFPFKRPDDCLETMQDIEPAFADGREIDWSAYGASDSPVYVGTRFVREVWELPDAFIALTSCEGEGAFLYDIASEAVYDFGLDARDEMISGTLTPRWPTFVAFLDWYFREE